MALGRRATTPVSTRDGRRRARSKRQKNERSPAQLLRHTCTSHISRPRGAHIHVHVHVAALRARCAPRARGRVEAELSSGTLGRRRWRKRQRQCVANLGKGTSAKAPFASKNTQFRFCNIVTTFSARGARCVGEHSSLRSTRGPTAAPPHVHTPPPASITCLVPTPTAYLLPPAPL